MNKNIWKFICLVLIVIIIILLIFIVNNRTNNELTEINKQSINQEREEIRQIRISEEFNKDGKVINLENVRWNNARIEQYNDEMEVSINLNNQSDTEKIPSKELIINLLDKSGKIIYTQKIQMSEISDHYGYITLNFKLKTTGVVIIHDIQIIA